jgi:ATP-binding cassette subfamily B protein
VAESRGSAGDAELDALESVAEPWQAHDATVAATGLRMMARRLPGALGYVLGTCWTVSRADTAVLTGCTIIAQVFTAVGLLATSGALDQLLTAGPTPARVKAAAPALILVVVSLSLRAALTQAASWAAQRLSPQVRRMVETGLYDLTTGVELTAFDDARFNDALHRVRQSAAGAVSSLLGAGLALVSSLIQLIAIGGVLAVLNPVLLPLLLVALVPAWWASTRSARLAYQLYFTLSGAERRRAKLSELMTERNPAAEIRSYTMRPFLLGQFQRLTRYIQAADLRTVRLQTASQALGETLTGIGTGVVYLVLAVLLFTGSMRLAVAGTALIAVRGALAALGGVGFALNNTYEQALFLDDYREFSQEARRRLERTGGTVPPADVDNIEVRDITFTYPSGDRPALDRVSLDIRPGEVIALVGENGSGKTTLAKVIGGLYRPQQGTVSYGGVPLDEVDLFLLRDRTAVIAQNFTHWPFTARENITIGRHDHPQSEQQLAEATAASGTDAVFARLANGPDTLLDASYQGGTELSGGQWQRIAIARGLYRDAPLLICDEPTAALDARTEHAIFEAIRQHAAQRTVVLITHRLASVRYADRIYVLEHGRVAEHGTHAELIALGGIYQEFYTLQASAYK